MKIRKNCLSSLAHNTGTLDSLVPTWVWRECCEGISQCELNFSCIEMHVDVSPDFYWYWRTYIGQTWRTTVKGLNKGCQFDWSLKDLSITEGDFAIHLFDLFGQAEAWPNSNRNSAILDHNSKKKNSRSQKLIGLHDFSFQFTLLICQVFNYVVTKYCEW